MTAAPDANPDAAERLVELRRGERIMVHVRWFAALFAAGQVLSYSVTVAPPMTVPLGLGLAGTIVAYNLIALVAHSRVTTLRGARTMTLLTLALDATVASAFVWLYTFDPTSALWAILYIVVLEGASRLQLAGGVGVWGFVAISYTLREIWGSGHYGYALEWNSVTFRMGIALLIGMIGGLMARDLDRQRRTVAASLREVARVTEASARASTERLQALFDAAPLAICELDLRGRVRRWSRAAEEILGRTGEEMMDGRFEIVEERSVDDFSALLRAAVAGDATTGQDICLLHADGREVHVIIASAPLRDQDGSVGGVLLIAADVTARKRMEQQALEAQRMEAVGRLAGGIAHDFNNLMTVVIGYAKTARRKLAAGRPIDDDLDAIAMAGERAATLVSQLLAFSRQQPLAKQQVEMGALIHGLRPLLSRLIPENVRLEMSALHDDLRVLADPSQLEQVLVNLVINARDAMPDGGAVRVEAARVPEDAPVHAGWVSLKVSDDGVGMTPEVRAKVFEPFFTTKGPGKGTGLGLSMVYGTVEASGGMIAIDTAPGEGTTFTLVLPPATVDIAEHTDSPSSGRADALTAPSGPAPVVLVAEDEPSLRELVSMTLELSGCRVLAAEDGEHALELAAEHAGPIDLLVTDVVMPRRSGPQLLTALRAEHPALPAVVMSGYADESAGDLPAGDGRTVFLPKPFELERLDAAVRGLLESRSRV